MGGAQAGHCVSMSVNVSSLITECYSRPAPTTMTLSGMAMIVYGQRDEVCE